MVPGWDKTYAFYQDVRSSSLLPVSRIHEYPFCLFICLLTCNNKIRHYIHYFFLFLSLYFFLFLIINLSRKSLSDRLFCCTVVFGCTLLLHWVCVWTSFLEDRFPGRTRFPSLPNLWPHDLVSHSLCYPPVVPQGFSRSRLPCPTISDTIHSRNVSGVVTFTTFCCTVVVVGSL